MGLTTTRESQQNTNLIYPQERHNQVMTTRGGAAPVKVFTPTAPAQKIGQVTIKPIQTKKPEPLCQNLMRIFKKTLHEACEKELITAIKIGKWLCLSLDEFSLEEAEAWLNETVELAIQKDLGLVKQIVIADAESMDEIDLISATTILGEAGGYFYPYSGKSFEEAAEAFDNEIQEAIDDFTGNHQTISDSA